MHETNAGRKDKGFLLGLDLGQLSDFTAACIVHRLDERVESIPSELAYQRRMERSLAVRGRGMADRRRVFDFPEPTPKKVRHYRVVALRRWPRNTPYPQIVSDVRQTLHKPPYQGVTKLVLDRTGVGLAIFDMFKEAGVQPIGITLTGGDQAHGYNVPKKDVIGALQATMGTERLKAAEGLELWPVLRSEMQNLEVRVKLSTGNVQVAADWRSGDHDDLVLSLACVLWYGESGRELDPEDFPICPKI